MTLNLKGSVDQEFSFIVKKNKQKKTFFITNSNKIHIFCVSSITWLKQDATRYIWYYIFLHLKIHSSCGFSSVLLISLSINNKSVFDIYFTEFGAALEPGLPVLLKYCYIYFYSDSRKLWAIMKAGGLALSNLFQPTISLEMPVPSQGHYGFQFSSCWLILSVYILMSFDFPFVRLFGVR